jgi:hypothetical protein
MGIYSNKEKVKTQFDFLDKNLNKKIKITSYLCLQKNTLLKEIILIIIDNIDILYKIDIIKDAEIHGWEKDDKLRLIPPVFYHNTDLYLERIYDGKKYIYVPETIYNKDLRQLLYKQHNHIMKQKIKLEDMGIYFSYNMSF